MSYEIDAHMQGDKARLEIIDVETGRVRLAWDYPLREGLEQPAGKERLCVQRLFRELFLLSAIDRLRSQG